MKRCPNCDKETSVGESHEYIVFCNKECLGNWYDENKEK